MSEQIQLTKEQALKLALEAVVGAKKDTIPFFLEACAAILELFAQSTEENLTISGPPAEARVATDAVKQVLDSARQMASRLRSQEFSKYIASQVE